MQQRKAFKFQLKTNLAQAAQLRRFAGSCRFVFNKALAWQKQNYEAGNTFIGYVAMAKQLTAWRHSADTTWLSDAPAQALQQSLKDLEGAYRNFFEKRAAFPRFKKKGQHDRFRYPQGVKLDQANSRLFLPKLGWIRYRKSRNVEGLVKNITVSCVAGTWYASIQTERDVAQPVHPSVSIIGIDVGIARFATLSDGTVFEPVHSYRTHQKRLAFLQRQMSRKVKFGANWKKAKARVQKLHAKVRAIRCDSLHKTSTEISKTHAVIVLEDLQVRNLSQSAAGTAENPGRTVKAKSGLNRCILDQGWAEFRRQLDYKQRWLGGHVLAVNPRNTSRTCLACGHVARENRRTQVQFHCVACGYREHADVNAAKNILAAGHAVIACGESALLSRSMKQEPAEATACELAHA